MPQLSIIVTSYNIESYIEQCLDSVVGQSLADIEIIVVDDGSSDSTPQIIERYAAEDPRIVPVLLTENTVGGVATAANTGLELATAPYVGFADGDDFLEPEMFERLLDAAQRHDADLAMCDYALFDDEDASYSDPADRKRWSQIDKPVYDLDVDTRKQFLRFIAVPWRKLYRRSMLDEHGIRFPVGDYFYEDNPFHWFNLLTAERIAVVPEVLCTHRVARAGQTMATADERLFKIFEHHATIRDWLQQRGLFDEYGPTLLAWSISQLEWIGPRTPTKLRRRLFEIAGEVYATHDPQAVEIALAEGNKGQRARSFSTAVIEGNFANFNRAFDASTNSTHPVVRAAYHLRYSGLRHTASLTKRYAANAVRSSRRVRARSSQIDSADLMFALTVIERRLDLIEHRIDEIHQLLDSE